MTKSLPRYFIPVALLLCVAFVVFSLFTFSFCADDMLIMARYAKNLVEHGIWNWNADHDYVEANTSFLYTVLMIIPELIGMNTFLFLKIINVLLFGVLIFRFWQHLADKRLFLIACSFMVFNPFIYIHLYSGFETFLFLFLLIETAIIVLLKRPNERYLYLLLLFLPLTRPEGALFSIILFALAAQNGQVVKRYAYFIAMLLLAGVYMVWRVKYFGYLLPNTFYVKSVNDSYMHHLVSLVSIYFNNSPYLFLLVALFFMTANFQFRVLVVVSMVLLVFLYYPSALATDIGARFFSHGAYYLMLIAFFIYKDIYNKKAFLLLSSFLVVLHFSTTVPAYKVIFPYAKDFHYGHIDIGKRLAKYKDKNYKLMLCEAGAIPYYAEWKTFDLLALCDTYLARNPLSVAYMEKCNPDVIVVFANQPSLKSAIVTLSNDKNNTAQEVFFAFLKKHPEYELAAIGKRYMNSYNLILLNKKNPDYIPLKNDFEAHQKLSYGKKFSLTHALLQKYFIADL